MLNEKHWSFSLRNSDGWLITDQLIAADDEISVIMDFSDVICLNLAVISFKTWNACTEIMLTDIHTSLVSQIIVKPAHFSRTKIWKIVHLASSQSRSELVLRHWTMNINHRIPSSPWSFVPIYEQNHICIEKTRPRIIYITLVDKIRRFYLPQRVEKAEKRREPSQRSAVR